MTRKRLKRTGWATELGAGFAGGLVLSVGLHAGMAWLGEQEAVVGGPEDAVRNAAKAKSDDSAVAPVAIHGKHGGSRAARAVAVAARPSAGKVGSLAGVQARVGGASEVDGRGTGARQMATPTPALRPSDVASLRAALPAPRPQRPDARPAGRSGVGASGRAAAIDQLAGSLFGAEPPQTVVRRAALHEPDGAGPGDDGADRKRPAEQVFADARPLDGSELGSMRGGFFDVDGWKIAFGVHIDVKVEGLEIQTRINDVGSIPKVEVDVAGDNLTRRADGTFEVKGLDVENTGKVQNVQLGNLNADVDAKDGDFELKGEANGTPVKLSVKEHKVVQEVGTEDTTLVRQDLSPDKIISQLNNIQNGVENRSKTTVNVDLLNHSERVKLSRRFLAAERLTRHIQSGLISRIVK